MAEQKKSGLVVKDEQGNTYYFRPEILSACQMPEKDVEDLKQRIESETSGDVKGFGLSLARGGFGKSSTLKVASKTSLNPTALSGALSGKLATEAGVKGKINPGEWVGSTVMCPW